MPHGLTFHHVFASSILCGIGFTMSIFITTLAFPGAENHGLVDLSRIAIFIGSILAALLGYFALNRTLKLEHRMDKK